jgi:hypothetical protein
LKKLGLLLVLVVVISAALASVAFAQGGGGAKHNNHKHNKHKQHFRAQLDELNGSGASGDARLTLHGKQLTTKINSTGLSANLPHAQHIHGKEQAESECPTLEADADGDGLVSTLEGLDDYGPIQVSFTTSGDTSPASGLALDRFPVANPGESLNYKRAFGITPEVKANLDEWHIVQHGVDLDGSGMYDGETSDLGVPLEAELPATCGKIERLR